MGRSTGIRTMERRRFIALLGGGSAFAGTLSKYAAASPLLADPLPQEKQPPGHAAPFALHPENPKYFLFRGKPLVLVAASEHYGSVINRRFDFARYLADAADKKQTVTRTFLLYRELQSVRNPYSPLKAESPDFVTPYPRLGPGKAMDGEPKYDLDQWNPEYFDRLHRFLSLASDFGVVVELTVFSDTYADEIWALNPLRDKNNLQGIGKIDWADYNSLRDGALVERQKAYARKIVQETSAFENIYYEICNEPGGGLPNHATAGEVDAWQEEMGRVLRDELRKMNRPHLVVGQVAFSYTPKFYQGFDASFSGSMLDAVNVHPLPDLTLRGHTYQLGNFMSKELQLKDFRDFFLAAQHEPKPCISDEDNAASMYCDEVGWTIQRKRAWMAVMCGAHYDFIDFSIKAGQEAGTEESRKMIRTWMRHLSEFIHSFDFIHAQPVAGWIESQPEHLVEATLAKHGSDYIAYLADSREISDPTAGQPISGRIVFLLPKGTYRVCFYSPSTGLYSPGIQVQGGNRVTLEIPSFEQDIVLRASREP
ncbi:MAG: hypothetical protein ACLQVM_23000 [Terriglobia bacterium]